MVRPGRTRDRLWLIPVAGWTLALVLAVAPGPPFSLDRWPLSGPFGAFTWGSWVASTGLAFSMLLLAAVLWFRRGRGQTEGVGRLLTAALAFGLVALASFVAADRAEVIERSPVLALVVALALAALLRMLMARVARRSLVAREPIEARPLVPARWRVPLGVAIGLAGLIALFFICGEAVRMVEPRVGSIVTVRRPALFFWAESAYFDALARREVAPERQALLPAGATLQIKGWVKRGVLARVAHDPSGSLADEIGYVRLGDLDLGVAD
jgi:hypothetical protein